MAAVATVVNGNTYTIDPRYDLTESKILGKGSFGVVCSAFDTVRDITLAIKRIRPYANDEWDAKHTLREVRLMRLLGQHPNVITLYELSLYLPKTELYMMIELMDSDLHKVIQSNKPLTMRHNKCFLKQMLEGIKAMHAIGVLHRDLKPGNILVSKDCQLRITDFGLARFMDDQTKRGENEVSPMTQYVVTRWYRPPELLLAPKLPYGEAVDLWSIGCILAELIKRKALFPGKDHLNQVDLIFQACGYESEEKLGFPIDSDSARVLQGMRKYSKQPFSNYLPNADAESLDMLEALLTVDPTKRPTAEQALQHPFLADAEVLHDYSKQYLTRPGPDYFSFESTPFTVPELRKMIHEEVHSLAADAYQRRSPASGDTTTPASPESSTAELLSTASSANKPIRRRSDTEEQTRTQNSAENSVHLAQAQAQAQRDLDEEGPASQLPTAKLFAGNNESIYLAKNTSNSNVLKAPVLHEKEKKKENPFARPTPAAAAAAGAVASTPISSTTNEEAVMPTVPVGVTASAASASSSSDAAPGEERAVSSDKFLESDREVASTHSTHSTAGAKYEHESGHSTAGAKYPAEQGISTNQVPLNLDTSTAGNGRIPVADSAKKHQQQQKAEGTGCTCVIN